MELQPRRRRPRENFTRKMKKVRAIAECVVGKEIPHVNPLRMLGFRIDKPDSEGDTPLFRMIKARKPLFVKNLLGLGASKIVTNNAGDTVLHHAVKYGSAQILQLLLDHGCDVDALNHEHQETPVMTAIYMNKTNFVAMLIKYVSLNKINSMKIMFAAIEAMRPTMKHHNYEILKILLEAGVDPNPIGYPRLLTPLLHAASKLNPDYAETNFKVIKLLIEHGADTSKVNSSGNGILHYVALCNEEGSHMELFEYLLAVKGLDPNLKNKEFETPFHLVLGECDVETCKLFLKHGASATEMDGLGATAMHFAANQKYVEVLHLLVQNGCPVTSGICSRSLFQMLDDGEMVTNTENVRFLLENGADCELNDLGGLTMSPWIRLFCICSFTRMSKRMQRELNEIMRLFLLYGAKLNSLVDTYNSNVFGYMTLANNNTWKVLVEHVAALQMSGKTVHPSILQEIASNPLFSSYSDDCRKEIEGMKAQEIDHFSMYKVLVEDRERFRSRNYAGSKALYKAINAEDLGRRYPIYKLWLVEKYIMGSNYTRLRDNAETLVNEISQPYNLPWMALEKISGYLDKCDMSLIFNCSEVKTHRQHWIDRKFINSPQDEEDYDDE